MNRDGHAGRPRTSPRRRCGTRCERLHRAGDLLALLGPRGLATTRATSPTTSWAQLTGERRRGDGDVRAEVRAARRPWTRRPRPTRTCARTASTTSTPAPEAMKSCTPPSRSAHPRPSPTVGHRRRPPRPLRGGRGRRPRGHRRRLRRHALHPDGLERRVRLPEPDRRAAGARLVPGRPGQADLEERGPRPRRGVRRGRDPHPARSFGDAAAGRPRPAPP